MDYIYTNIWSKICIIKFVFIIIRLFKYKIERKMNKTLYYYYYNNNYIYEWNFIFKFFIYIM